MTVSTEPLLAIENLVVEFTSAAGPVRVVDGVSYSLGAGETLGIVGETGSGKSVTVLAALGLLPRHRLHQISGSVSLTGQDLLQLDERARRSLLGREIAMVFQDPISALNPVQRIGDQIAEAILLHGDVKPRIARQQAIELLDLVGVPQPDVRATQFPHQFSGGMCQRAVIAMAIANRPKVLIADEPTTAVDVSVQAQLLRVLQIAQQETGAATVMISHDLGVIAEVADRMCVMYAGRVVESGPVAEVFAQPRHPYTAGLLGCIPRLDRPIDRLVPVTGQPPSPRRLPSGCAFAPRCAHSAGRAECHETKPALLPYGDGVRTSACHFATELDADESSLPRPDAVPKEEPAATNTSPAHKEAPLLEVTDLVKRFPLKRGVLSGVRGWVHAVDGVSFTIGHGETLGLVGESGCGKSTTSRLLLRLEEPSSGQVIFDGHDVVTAGKRALRSIRQNVQMVFQDPNSSLNPRMSVGDIVAEPLRLAGGISQRDRRARVLELFDRVGLLGEYVTRYPAEFSGGQRQRIAIARALALQPRLLLLDEPVSALDVSVQAQVLNLLDELQVEFGLAYLFVSHDLSVVRHVSDRVAVMYLGKIVEAGPRDEVFTRPQHPYTRALLASVPTPDPAGRRDRVRAPLTGEVPSPTNPPSGCRFRTRCPLATEICTTTEPALIKRIPDSTTLAACHFAEGRPET